MKIYYVFEDAVCTKHEQYTGRIFEIGEVYPDGSAHVTCLGSPKVKVENPVPLDWLIPVELSVESLLAEILEEEICEQFKSIKLVEWDDSLIEETWFALYNETIAQSITEIGRQALWELVDQFGLPKSEHGVSSDAPPNEEQ